jgi:kynurenine formamidase
MEAGTERSTRLDEAQFRRLYEGLRSSLPWGPADRRGALNYIEHAQVLAAAREVKLGLTVSLAGPIENHPAADNPQPAGHKMTGPAGGHAPESGLDFAMDQISMNVHGNADSHLDSLCHVIYDDHLYNGVPAETVTSDGADALSVEEARDGIVSRAVLLDIPRLRGVSWLEPGDHVTTDELLAAEREQKVRLDQGDIALVRVGHRQRRRELGPWDASQSRAGLHPDTVPLLADRRVSALGSDGNNDTAPSIAAGVDFPVHVLAINAVGIRLLDYLDFDEVIPHCEQAGRWSFLCVIAPLRLQNATGSPVNPIALL